MRIVRTRCVVVGSGIAGMSAALGHGDAVIVSKTVVGDGSSRWAQGGIAAAIGDDDSPHHHADDTVRVSAGLGHHDIASLVAEAAGDRVAWLRSLGAAFDLDADGELSLGREAGHSRNRIIHADGDATGAEVMRALVGAATARADLHSLPHTFALDLIVDANGHAAGILALDAAGQLVTILAPSVVLATGGIGRLYRHTTNPPEVTGDGLAMAIRAGARVRDLEFVQFHPTALDHEIDPMPLLTEALRGEGATLVDGDGRRFMLDAHDDAELAPRDIVARHIHWQRQHGPVFLDARAIGADFPSRFPTVWSIAQRAGLDPRVDLLPVSPAEHYHMGGIATDAHGRTSIPGLYAAGEVASTGLHGANRLASNSLLEGLVFGARVAEAAGPAPSDVPTGTLRVAASALEADGSRSPVTQEAIDALRETMWQQVGLIRDHDGLSAAIRALDERAPTLAADPEGRNLATVALAIARAALDRPASCGSHHRNDHPVRDDSPEHHDIVPEPEPTTALTTVTNDRLDHVELPA